MDRVRRGVLALRSLATRVLRRQTPLPIDPLQQSLLPGQMQVRLDRVVAASRAFGHVFRPRRVHAVEHLAYQFRELLRQRLGTSKSASVK